MPLRGCSSSGLLATAVVAFLAIPVQYYVPDIYLGSQEVLSENLVSQATLETPDYFHWISLANLPPFDLFLTISLLTLAFVTYLCDWIQRKLLERRIIKMNRCLCESVERVRRWDARQEQLEATLRMVRNATSEYNLLLFLLLRQHRQLAKPHPHPHPHPHCYFDKGIDDFNYTSIRNPTIDV